jgi:hypothetical protein
VETQLVGFSSNHGSYKLDVTKSGFAAFHPSFANPDLNLRSGNYNKIRSLLGNAGTRAVVAGAPDIF